MENFISERGLMFFFPFRWTWQFAMHDAIPPQPKEGLGRLGATGGASRSGGAFASAFRKAEEAEEDLEEAAGSSDFA